MVDSTTLLIAAVRREAEGVSRRIENAHETSRAGCSLVSGRLSGHSVSLLFTGVGTVRTASTLAAVLASGPFSKVLQFGVAGAYPNSGLDLLDLVLASGECDPQSGIVTESGFSDLTKLGFPITDEFPNRLPIRNEWTETIAAVLPEAARAEVASVVTCSGTDRAALETERLSGAKIEAMEGFAAAWVCSRFGVPFAELRAVSNTTGNRANQRWNLDGACDMLTVAVTKIFRSPE